MIYILERAIDKYNNNLNDNGIEKVGIGKIIGIKDDEVENINFYFDSEKGIALVLYASFPENFIGDFWRNHPLLSDILGINPDKTVLTSKLKLGKSILSENKSNDKSDGKSNMKSNYKTNNKSNKSNNESNNSNNGKNDNMSLISEEDKRELENNKEYYKLSLGASFEYNSLHFLLYGIEQLINLPRIIFYPVVKFMDYEEIDNVFIVNKLKPDNNNHYSNFRYIDLDNFINNNQEINLDSNSIINYNKNRKIFELKENDLVFVETTFEFESKKNKVHQFFTKIIKFIYLYINTGLIKNLNDYTIKPIILYNNDYYLDKKNFKNIKSSIDTITNEILGIKDETLDKSKLTEIYNNLQIIYCWPTIPIFNNYTTYKDVNEKIEKIITENKGYKKEIEKIKIENEEYKKDIQELRETIQNIKDENEKKTKYYKPYNNNKRFNKKYYNNNYTYYNYQSNYYNRNNYKYNNNVNNANKKNYVNNNNYYNNNIYYW